MGTTTEIDLGSQAPLKPRTVSDQVNAKRLLGKVAIITGGSTGMGLAAAKRFVLEGADHVFITGRRKDALEGAVSEIGKNVTGVPGDVASLRDLDRLYESVDGYGRKIDVVFANAGISQQAPLGTVDETSFDLHFNANVKGLFFTVQKALPLLKDGASIILNASIATIKGFPGISVYSATKAAVRSFARTWTNELRERRIRVMPLARGTSTLRSSRAGSNCRSNGTDKRGKDLIAFDFPGGRNAFRTRLSCDGSRSKSLSACQSSFKGYAGAPSTRGSHPGHDE